MHTSSRNSGTKKITEATATMNLNSSTTVSLPTTTNTKTATATEEGGGGEKEGGGGGRFSTTKYETPVVLLPSPQQQPGKSSNNNNNNNNRKCSFKISGVAMPSSDSDRRDGTAVAAGAVAAMTRMRVEHRHRHHPQQQQQQHQQQQKLFQQQVYRRHYHHEQLQQQHYHYHHHQQQQQHCHHQQQQQHYYHQQQQQHYDHHQQQQQQQQNYHHHHQQQQSSPIFLSWDELSLVGVGKRTTISTANRKRLATMDDVDFDDDATRKAAVPSTLVPDRYPTRLSLPDDVSQLNTLHCFLRSELLEIFCIAKSNKKSPCHSPTGSSVGRVGLRCVHCAMARGSRRGDQDDAPMAVFYPKSIAEMYRLVTSWQRCHLRKCHNVPPAARARWQTLRENDKSRGKPHYWVTSAKHIGLMDCHSRAGGIRFAPDFDPRTLPSEIILTSSIASNAVVSTECDDQKTNGTGIDSYHHHAYDDNVQSGASTITAATAASHVFMMGGISKRGRRKCTIKRSGHRVVQGSSCIGYGEMTQHDALSNPKVTIRHRHDHHYHHAKKDEKSGMILPEAASEVDFDVRDPPLEPSTPASKEPICEFPADVNSFDVLWGRGGGTNSQVGNRRFRKLVQEIQPIYFLARRKEKPLWARTIVLIIRKRGGRFLKKDDETDELYEVGDSKAEAKTSQALRELYEMGDSKAEAKISQALREGLDVDFEDSKRRHHKCAIEGCRNRVVQGGICIAHGAKRKLCKYPGCTKHIKKAGICSTHGVHGGRCIAHGANDDDNNTDDSCDSSVDTVSVLSPTLALRDESSLVGINKTTTAVVTSSSILLMEQDGEDSVAHHDPTTTNEAALAAALTTTTTTTTTTTEEDEDASSRLRSAASSSSSRCDSRKGLAVASGTIQLRTGEKDTTARGGTVGKATRNWNSNYNAVKKYVESHNGRYQKNSITGNNLGSWVSTQKRAYNKNNNMELTQQKITDLEKLPNWRWSKNWNSTYNAVKKYVESHNGRYPKNSITDNNLGSWVSTQKRAHDKNNNMNLTQQKITDLEKLPNWRWSKNSHTKQKKSISSSIAASSIAAALSVNTVFPKKGDTKRKIDDNNASDTTIIVKKKKSRISISTESVNDNDNDDDDDDDENLFIII